MRRALLLVLVLLPLTGCVSRYDGSWLLIFTMVEDSENDDNPYIGVEQQVMTSIYHTNQQAVVNMANMTLIGTQQGGQLDVANTWEADYNGENCDTFRQTRNQTLTATFSNDLGVEGESEMSEGQTVSGCPPMDDTDEMHKFVYEVTGSMLNAGNEKHASEDANWGYIPGGIY